MQYRTLFAQYVNDAGEIAPLTLASVNVYAPGTTTPVTVYAADGTTVLTQPLTTTAATGQFAFATADGLVDIKVTSSDGAMTYTLPNEQFGDVVTAATSAAASATAAAGSATASAASAAAAAISAAAAAAIGGAPAIAIGTLSGTTVTMMDECKNIATLTYGGSTGNIVATFTKPIPHQAGYIGLAFDGSNVPSFALGINNSGGGGTVVSLQSVFFKDTTGATVATNPVKFIIVWF
jgi:hypothetical protein